MNKFYKVFLFLVVVSCGAVNFGAEPGEGVDFEQNPELYST